VILIVIVECELVLGRFIHRSRLSISTIKQDLVYLAILQNNTTTKKICYYVLHHSRTSLN
jgi:hypothetical protein